MPIKEKKIKINNSFKAKTYMVQQNCKKKVGKIHKQNVLDDVDGSVCAFHNSLNWQVKGKLLLSVLSGN